MRSQRRRRPRLILHPAPSAPKIQYCPPAHEGAKRSVPGLRDPVASRVEYLAQHLESCTSGSRTTPPRPTASRPASNCGLTSATIFRRVPGPFGRRKDKLQPNKRHIDRNEIDRLRQDSRNRTFVRSIATTRSSAPQLCCQLSVPHIDGVNASRAQLQKTVSESTGAGAKVRGDESRTSRSNASRACASFSPPRLTNRGRALKRNKICRLDCCASAQDGRPIDKHITSHDQRLRSRAALSQASRYEIFVQPRPHRRGSGLVRPTS